MKKIEKERMWIAATILGGMAANYHNGLYPEIDARVKTAVLMADTLLKRLSEKPAKLSK